MLTQLNQLRDAIHANAVAKGFYEEIHPDEHYLALIIEEIGEAITADRNGERAEMEEFQLALSQGKDFQNIYGLFIKGSLEEELADIAIRLLDFAGHKEIDLSQGKDFLKFYSITSGKAIKDTTQEFKDKGFAAVMFTLTKSLSDIANPKLDPAETLANNLMYLDILAQALNINLLYHIHQKMAYNATRPYKHGKAY